MMKITISGSFNHYFSEFVDYYKEVLSFKKFIILSPKGSEIRDDSAEFMFLKSDDGTSIKDIETAHLAAIKGSDLLLVVNPKNYIGISTAMEIGYAIGNGTPIYFTNDIPSFLEDHVKNGHGARSLERDIHSLTDEINIWKKINVHVPSELVLDNEKREIGIEDAFKIGLFLSRGSLVYCRKEPRDLMLKEFTKVFCY